MTEFNQSQSDLAPALGKLVSGLYIVSLKSNLGEMGFLASWVQQAGFNPPMLTIAFNKERKLALEHLQHSGKAVVNIMSKDNGKTMSAFFKPAPESGSIFDALETKAGLTGVPILLDSVAFLECQYHSEMETGDHVIVLFEILSGGLNNPEQIPSTHIRPDGFKY